MFDYCRKEKTWCKPKWFRTERLCFITLFEKWKMSELLEGRLLADFQDSEFSEWSNFLRCISENGKLLQNFKLQDFIDLLQRWRAKTPYVLSGNCFKNAELNSYSLMIDYYGYNYLPYSKVFFQLIETFIHSIQE